MVKDYVLQRLWLSTCWLLHVTAGQTWPVRDTHPPVLEDQCKRGHLGHCRCCIAQGLGSGCAHWRVTQIISTGVLHYTVEQYNEVTVYNSIKFCDKNIHDCHVVHKNHDIWSQKFGASYRWYTAINNNVAWPFKVYEYCSSCISSNS